jgi:hypothetical protein
MVTPSRCGLAAPPEMQASPRTTIRSSSGRVSAHRRAASQVFEDDEHQDKLYRRL